MPGSTRRLVGRCVHDACSWCGVAGLGRTPYPTLRSARRDGSNFQTHMKPALLHTKGKRSIRQARRFLLKRRALKPYPSARSAKSQVLSRAKETAKAKLRVICRARASDRTGERSETVHGTSSRVAEAGGQRAYEDLLTKGLPLCATRRRRMQQRAGPRSACGLGSKGAKDKASMPVIARYPARAQRSSGLPWLPRPSRSRRRCSSRAHETGLE